MFMDPNAFEAEDIERELADAGIKPEKKAAAGFYPGDGNEKPPSSGSSYGLGPRAGRGGGGGGGYPVGGSGGGGNSMLQPRAMGKDRAHQAPTYGRHSKGTAGRRSGDRTQFSASSPSLPLGNRSPPEGQLAAISGQARARPESHSFDYQGNGSSAGLGEEKLDEDAPEQNPEFSLSMGLRSRARVLAQQRELQRKRRQQALTAGGIRASDAETLSRGIVSAIPRLPQTPNESGTDSEGRSGIASGPGMLGGANGGGGVEEEDEREEGLSFSPSVKQFSAPRQMEGDGYMAFNSNPRHATERMSGVSEFEYRPSSGLVGVLSDSDEDDNRDGLGGGRSTRRGKKLVPDMGDRSGNDFEESNDSKRPGSKEENDKPRMKNRPDDWDDGRRPSSKTFPWGRGSGGGGSEAGTGNNGDGSNNTWRTVGREPSDATATKRKSEKKNHHTRGGRNHSGRSRSSSSSSTTAGSGEEYSSDRAGERSSVRSSRRSRSGSTSRSHSSNSSGNDSHDGRRRRGGRHSDKAQTTTQSGRKRGGDGRKSNRRHPSDVETGEGRSGRGGGDSRKGGGGRRTGHGHSDSGSTVNGRRRNRSDSPGSDERRRSDASDRRSEGGRERRENGHASSSRHHRRGTVGSRDGGGGGSGGGGGGGGGRGKNYRRPQRSNHRRSGSDENGQESGRGDDDKSVIGGGGEHRSKNSAGLSNGRSQEWVGRGSGKLSSGEWTEEGKTKDGDESQVSDSRDGNKSPQGGDGKDRAPPDGITADPATARAVHVGDEMEFNMDALDLSDMKKFLLSPCPRAAGVVQCYIKRNKTRGNKLFPEYTLFMKEGDRFLMCSKKRPNNATSNYLVSMEAGDLGRNSRNFLGKLRANFVGTEFQVFDNGYNPREQTNPFGISKTLGGSGSSGGGWAGGGGEQPIREELGCVMYASNVLGSRGPRKMQVAIPSVSEDSVVSKWSELDGGRGSQTSGGGSKAIERVKNRDYDGSLYMVNKPPRWNDQVGAYVLNFYGRVTMASVKNFQLVSTEDFDRIILQFGRVAKDEFTMDFQFPISPFQAFAITLSSFDSKIACD